MVCSICNENECRATSCNSDILKRTVAMLKTYWLRESAFAHQGDEYVKEWARTTRISLPFWNRIWSIIMKEVKDRHWVVDHQNPAVLFVWPKPKTISEFKQRIQDYQRPDEYPRVQRPPVQRPRVQRPRVLELKIIKHVKHLTKQIKLIMDNEAEKYYINDTCTICLNDITQDNVLAFGCKHTLCNSCAIKLIEKTKLPCPTCRKKISEVHFKPSIHKEDFNKLSSYICFT